MVKTIFVHKSSNWIEKTWTWMMQEILQIVLQIPRGVGTDFREPTCFVDAGAKKTVH